MAIERYLSTLYLVTVHCIHYYVIVYTPKSVEMRKIISRGNCISPSQPNTEEMQLGVFLRVIFMSQSSWKQDIRLIFGRITHTFTGVGLGGGWVANFQNDQ